MHRVDHQISTPELFATVEIKAARHPVLSKWVITGLGADNLPSLALAVSVPLMAKSEEDSIVEAEELFNSSLKHLALRSLLNGGLTKTVEKNSDPSNPAYELHAAYFQERLRGKNIENETFLTAGLYLLAKLLEVKKPIDFLTTFMRLPESTISRRLTKARDVNLISKRRETSSD